MTLAFWFCSLQHARSRQPQTGARRRRSGAFRRGASFEVMEDRFLLSSVSFSTGSETVNESAGTFSIPVTQSDTVSTVGFDLPGPTGLALDSAGNLYVANDGNGTVSKVTPEGVVSTFASGFQDPAGLAVDSAGNLYVANFYASAINKVTPAGKISTFATGLGDSQRRGRRLGRQPLRHRRRQWNVGCGDARGTRQHAGLWVQRSLVLGDRLGRKLLRRRHPSQHGEQGDARGEGQHHRHRAQPSRGRGRRLGWQRLRRRLRQQRRDRGDTRGGQEHRHPGIDRSRRSGRRRRWRSLRRRLWQRRCEWRRVQIQRTNDRAVYARRERGSFGSGLAIGVTASPLTFGIGQTTQNITGTLLSDPGPAQSLTLTLGTPTGSASLGSPSVNTLTINEPAAVMFSTGSETVNESAGTFSIPVTLLGTPSGVVTVPFALGGTAVSGVAYSGVTATPLTFAVGQTTQNITGTLLSDPGPAQTLTLTLGFPTGDAALFTRSVVNTLTIAEPAGVQFGTGSETVNESAGTFSIPVTLFGTVTPTVSTFASGFKDSVGLAFDSAHNLYVSDNGNNTVFKVTPMGMISTFATGFDGPFALAFDAAGNLYVANSGNNTVSEVTPAGVMSTFASGFNDPTGLAFDSAGNLYVASSGINTVIELSPAGVVVKTLTTGFNDPVGLAFDSTGNLYVANRDAGSVSKVTPASVVSTFASGLSGPAALAFDASGTLYVSNFVGNIGERGDARRGGQHLRFRVQRSLGPGL